MLEYPITISIGEHSILMHSIMETLGIFIGARCYWFLRKKKKEKTDIIITLTVLIGATFGAYAGSHLLGSFENIPNWMNSPDKLKFFLFNKTLVGGLLGGLLGVELSKKIFGEKRSTGDSFVYPLLVAMIIGRLGCFSAGIYEETYGLPTQTSWGLDLGDGILRHPVTLYEIVFLILVMIFIYRINRKYTFKSGALFKIFIISYLLFRFFLDFIKPGWRYFFNLGSIQIACLIGLIYYGKYIISPQRLTKKSLQTQ